MKRFLTLLTASCITSSALAASGTWFESNTWTTSIDTDAKFCMTVTRYNNGQSLGITLRPDGTSDLWIGKAGAREGFTYRLAAMTNKAGGTGVLNGTGYASGNIQFKGITISTLYYLAKSNYISIENIGGFRLVGSHQAIKSLVSCAEALKETI